LKISKQLKWCWS